MDRASAEHLLGDNVNPDGQIFFITQYKNKSLLQVQNMIKRYLRIYAGSFLMWEDETDRQHVLSLKYYDTQEGCEGYKYEHYKVKTDKGEVYFTKERKFDNLRELMNSCMENKEQGLATKLRNICLLPNPHSDPGFKFAMLDYDSLRVPYTEIVLGRELGSGQFGKVYSATFRGNLEVAVKQLKVENEEEGAKALEEFFKELDTLKKLNHPNLVQLFAYIVDDKKGNFMIQEFMAEGDLKCYLKKWKEDPAKMKAEPKLWSKLLSWNIEVARGMERLESLNIVHRDLAARSTSENFNFLFQECFAGPVLEGQGC